MRPEQLYHELIMLSEKLGTQVSEQNFRTAGIHVKSGHCMVEGSSLFLLDKHLKLSKKVEILAEFLCVQPIEDIFVVPAVRDFLDKCRPRIKPFCKSDVGD